MSVIVRLRRNPVALMAAGDGTALTLFAMGVLMLAALPQADGTVFIAICGLGSALILNARVVVTADELVAGNRLHSKRWSRCRVAGAVAGRVPWGRGGLVRGIEIEMVDGTVEPLPLSAFLLEGRQSRWIDAINEWAKGDQGGGNTNSATTTPTPPGSPI